MKDRITQYPHRYQLVPVSGQSDTYDIIAKPGTVTEPGTPLNKANLLSDTTANLYGLTGADANVDKAFVKAIDKMGKLTINNLLTSLKFTTNSTNIDAWCDLIASDSLINASASSGYTVSAGVLSASPVPLVITELRDSNISWGHDGKQKIGQTFFATDSAKLKNIKVILNDYGNPTDGVVMKIYATSGGFPTTLLGTSTNTISGNTITTSYVDYTFTFENISVIGGTTYAFVLERTTAPSNVDHYKVFQTSSNVYSGGNAIHYDGSIWSAPRVFDAYLDLYATINFYGTATVIWTAVTTSETLVKMAIVANQTLGIGSISWYLSCDGINWVPITSLAQVFNVNFASTTVCLKCVITGDSTIDAVAYGGI